MIASSLVGACFPRPLSRPQTIDLLIAIGVFRGGKSIALFPQFKGKVDSWKGALGSK
jgi:hypothetical protein